MNTSKIMRTFCLPIQGRDHDRDNAGLDDCLSSLSLVVFGLNESDAVSLQHNPPELFLFSFLLMNLCSLVQHQIHIFVKS